VLRGNVFTLLAIGRYGAAKERERAREYLVRASAARIETPERAALALFDALASQRNGKAEEAQALAREAADGLRRVRFPLLEAQALELAGDAEGALALFHRCGATGEVRRLESTAEGGGILSAREREIAQLAAGGRSNLEIARELSITHKTVEKHLGSAYRKLGISSRAQLGSFFSRVC
jgi:DNA-binding CsgD family transcriptional regulator